MTNTYSGMSKIRAAIETLDLDSIKFKLMNAKDGSGWSRDQADEADVMYRRFLYLTAKYPEATIVPTTIVDEIWHGHILDTEKYENDCQTMFGRTLHHFPYLGMRGEQDAENLKAAFEATEELFFSEFGNNLTNVRHFASAEASNSICSGSCRSCKGGIGGNELASNRPSLLSKTGLVSIF